jgi:uncharacterized protein YecE (DUF72 family)
MLVHIGTSGWNYGHWKGVFYPEGLASREWLRFYAEQFRTVELNVTFYRSVRPETFAKWRSTVPDGFLFSVKMSRYITHIKRLKVEQESMRRFFESVSVLAEKLGVILIQLPPSLKFDAELMTDFFGGLDPAFKYTVEARNATFVDERFFSLLRERNIAWCIADTAGRYPYHESVTAAFVYMRLHGSERLYASSYSDDELKAVREKIAAWGKEAFVYFDNDFCGFAPQNGRRLMELFDR